MQVWSANSWRFLAEGLVAMETYLNAPPGTMAVLTGSHQVSQDHEPRTVSLVWGTVPTPMALHQRLRHTLATSRDNLKNLELDWIITLPLWQIFPDVCTCVQFVEWGRSGW